MHSYLTPGVYFERGDAVAPAITALRTDIAGFVGIAERGPLHTAVPVESWRQFQATFGSFIGSGYLAYSLKGFFENGGRKCYVVRVADRDLAASASADLKDQTGKPAWRIEASSPGVWGNQLAVRLQSTHRGQTRTVIKPASADRRSSHVGSVTNFERGTLVRLFQAGPPPVGGLGVVREVDGERQRLIWSEPLDPKFVVGNPIFAESVEYTLTVYWKGRLVAIYEGLSLVPEHPLYAPNAVRISPLQRSDARNDLLPPPPPFVIVPDRVVSGASDPDFLPPNNLNGLVLETPVSIPLNGGTDGLATLSVNDFIGEPQDLMADDGAENSRRRGLRALEVVDEISIVAVPDIHIRPALPPGTAPLPQVEQDECLLEPSTPGPITVPPVFPEHPPIFSDEEIFRVQSALITHCEELHDRFAVIDSPHTAARRNAVGSSAVLAWRSRFETTFGALYFPWVRVLDRLRLNGEVVRDIPPSGHVAGLIARTDLDTGVHKAPANGELHQVEDVTVAVTEEIQAGLNPRGVNAIRAFSGRGIRVYGARTVSSDPDWRYVNVRRLLLMIEEALDVATQWAVFEPNDTYTRLKVQLAISTFLETLWRAGALAGTQPEQAFFVRCDETNNPAFERDRGRLLAEVGVAPAVPYEFVVLRIGRTAEGLEITETS